MTSAPKSDRIVAAAGPAMKLARSTTLIPEKILFSLIRSPTSPFVRHLEERSSSQCSGSDSCFKTLFRRPAHHTRLDCPTQYFSRKTRFRILPDPDLGSSSVMNSIWRGTLYEAIRVLQYCLSSSADKLVAGRRKTDAATSSPH